MSPLHYLVLSPLISASIFAAWRFGPSWVEGILLGCAPILLLSTLIYLTNDDEDKETGVARIAAPLRHDSREGLLPFSTAYRPSCAYGTIGASPPGSEVSSPFDSLKSPAYSTNFIRSCADDDTLRFRRSDADAGRQPLSERRMGTRLQVSPPPASPSSRPSPTDNWAPLLLTPQLDTPTLTPLRAYTISPSPITPHLPSFRFRFHTPSTTLPTQTLHARRKNGISLHLNLDSTPFTLSHNNAIVDSTPSPYTYTSSQSSYFKSSESTLLSYTSSPCGVRPSHATELLRALRTLSLDEGGCARVSVVEAPAPAVVTKTRRGSPWPFPCSSSSDGESGGIGASEDEEDEDEAERSLPFYLDAPTFTFSTISLGSPTRSSAPISKVFEDREIVTSPLHYQGTAAPQVAISPFVDRRPRLKLRGAGLGCRDVGWSTIMRLGAEALEVYGVGVRRDGGEGVLDEAVEELVRDVVGEERCRGDVLRFASEFGGHSSGAAGEELEEVERFDREGFVMVRDDDGGEGSEAEVGVHNGSQEGRW